MYDASFKVFMSVGSRTWSAVVDKSLPDFRRNDLPPDTMQNSRNHGVLLTSNNISHISKIRVNLLTGSNIQRGVAHTDNLHFS
jgi:hypothetical protein